jgi:hypothetical protein
MSESSKITSEVLSKEKEKEKEKKRRIKTKKLYIVFGQVTLRETFHNCSCNSDRLRSNATYHPFGPPFVLLKLMWLLKSPLDQNSILIYHKFNGDFKSYINFGRIKGGQGDDM